MEDSAVVSVLLKLLQAGSSWCGLSHRTQTDSVRDKPRIPTGGNNCDPGKEIGLGVVLLSWYHGSMSIWAPPCYLHCTRFPRQQQALRAFRSFTTEECSGS